jgi:hypothetical protein
VKIADAQCPAAISVAVLGSSFRSKDAMIFLKEEFDLLDAFIGKGFDPVVIVDPVDPDDAVLGLKTEGQLMDKVFADAQVLGDTLEGVDVVHLVALHGQAAAA